VKIPNAGSTLHLEWLARELPKGAVVAVDGQVLGLGAASALRAALDTAASHCAPTSTCWTPSGTGVRACPTEAVYEHEPPHATQTRAQKLAAVRDAMAKHQATHHLVSSVDDVAWITNLRGADVTYNPVFLAHLLITRRRRRCSSAPARSRRRWPRGSPRTGSRSAPTSRRVRRSRPSGPARRCSSIPGGPPTACVSARAAAAWSRKRSTPARCSRAASSRRKPPSSARPWSRTAVAMCEFYAWFEAALARASRITEVTVDERSARRARARAGFMGLSFATIAGFNANGAMPHYRATEERHARIAGDGLLLVDSVASTSAVPPTSRAPGPLGPRMRRSARLHAVLKGTMQLSRARFPRGTPSPMLDALARGAAVAARIDYGHGTGHGVGYFLAVHEGRRASARPCPTRTWRWSRAWSPRSNPACTPGQWGVRIENLVLAVRPRPTWTVPSASSSSSRRWTLCPIDTRCIEPACCARTRSPGSTPTMPPCANDWHPGSRGRARVAQRAHGTDAGACRVAATADRRGRRTECFPVFPAAWIESPNARLQLRLPPPQIVGIDSAFDTPFGRRLMVYCDYTASGRCLIFFERYLQTLQRHLREHAHRGTTSPAAA